MRHSALIVLASLTLAACAAPPLPAEPPRILVEESGGRYRAVVLGCPNWRELEGAAFANDPSPNFGCATAGNLAAMIADPRDLVAPPEPGGADGDVAAQSVQRYRARTVQPLIDVGSGGAGGGS